MRLHVDPAPAQVLATYPAQSTRSGYAEVQVAPIPAGIPQVFAQWVWSLPAGATLPGCAGTPSTRSASDALAMVVA